MKDLLRESDDMYQPMSDPAKQIIKDQGNVEAFEFHERTDTIQCEHCHKRVTAGHDHCYCGRLLKNENPDPLQHRNK